MGRKTRVGILFGGKSVEHEVSLQSARNILEALDRDKYEPVLVAIDKNGRWWHLPAASLFLEHADNPARIQLSSGGSPATLLPWTGEDAGLFSLHPGSETPEVDVFFPVLHGPLGEDGTIQGLFKLAGVPFVGSGVLASSVCMDKDISKRLLTAHRIPVVKWRLLKKSEPSPGFGSIAEELGLPVFVKPANLGSSVGIHKIHREEQFLPALQNAFQYDSKVLVEEAVVGREIECSVLGNEQPKASILGEVIPQKEFYSYEAKYLDEKGAILKVPAELPHEVSEKIRSFAIDSFKALGCEGMARVDFFYSTHRGVFVNEVNSIPGFTRISMYPRLWEASGVSYSRLLDHLIQLALQRFETEKQLKTSYDL